MSKELEGLKEYAAVIRSMIQHENELINHRLGWMSALQGFLIAAAGFFWESARESAQSILILIIAAIGISVCVSVGYSLGRADKAIKRLLSVWGEREELSAQMVDVGKLPPVIGSRVKAVGWLLPWRFLPWAMVLGWLGLIIVKYC